MPETMPDIGLVLDVARVDPTVAALVGVIAVALRATAHRRRLRRMDMPSTLRVVE